MMLIAKTLPVLLVEAAITWKKKGRQAAVEELKEKIKQSLRVIE